MNLSPHEIIEATRKVLSQDEFQFNPSEKNRFWLRFIEWLMEPRALGAIFYSAVAILGLYISWKAFQAIRQWVLSRNDNSKNSILAAEIKIEDFNKIRFAALKDVRTLIETSNNTVAIKILHSFLVEQLDSRKLLSKRKWKTNSHYIDECQREAQWASLFQNLSNDFDRAVYGSAEIPVDCIVNHLICVEDKFSQ